MCLPCSRGVLRASGSLHLAHHVLRLLRLRCYDVVAVGPSPICWEGMLWSMICYLLLAPLPASFLGAMFAFPAAALSVFGLRIRLAHLRRCVLSGLRELLSIRFRITAAIMGLSPCFFSQSIYRPSSNCHGLGGVLVGRRGHGSMHEPPRSPRSVESTAMHPPLVVRAPGPLLMTQSAPTDSADYLSITAELAAASGDSAVHGTSLNYCKREAIAINYIV